MAESEFGKPIDFILFQLERKADSLGKQLENHSKYIHLCSMLTKLDFDEPVPFKAKEECWQDLYAIVSWVLLGECISPSEWIALQQVKYNDMCSVYTNSKQSVE